MGLHTRSPEECAKVSRMSRKQANAECRLCDGRRVGGSSLSALIQQIWHEPHGVPDGPWETIRVDAALLNRGFRQKSRVSQQFIKRPLYLKRISCAEMCQFFPPDERRSCCCPDRKSSLLYRMRFDLMLERTTLPFLVLEGADDKCLPPTSA